MTPPGVADTHLVEPVAGPSRPEEHRPSPKVAVIVAGAALAVTTGLTLLVLPYVRQASKISTPPQFISHAFRARPLRAPTTPTTAPTIIDASSTAAPVPELLARVRRFNDREEERLYGRPALDEDGEPVEPVSPWLGFQALGIATAIVCGSAGLGAWGVAKYFGVSDMTEFSAKMRRTLEDSMPDLIENVRREDEVDEDEGGAAAAPSVSVLDQYGELDEDKLGEWVKSLEEEDVVHEEPDLRVV